ncbi:MAG TPA: PP2C family protein-serine/threonine phosphatase [Thermoanaerobaculia bacterium]|nr:PP2C family protein-serine/threonine phosphatase [Thermoanaerobaculia bacterium]
MTPSVPTRRHLLLAAVLGLLALAVGVALADAVLPEWRAGEPLRKAVYRQRVQEVTARAGLALAPGEPPLVLLTRDSTRLEPYRSLGDKAGGWLATTRTAVCVAAFSEVPASDAIGRAGLMVTLALNGQPEAFDWWSHDINVLSPSSIFGASHPRIEPLAAQLLLPGEAIGAGQWETILTMPRVAYPLAGGDPRPEFVFGMASQQNGLLQRRPGAATPARLSEADDALASMFTGFWLTVPSFLALVIFFVVLAVRSRLGIVNAALLALATLLSLLPGLRLAGPWTFGLAVTLPWVLRIFLLWACAESLLRSTAVDFTTSLDALRAGRLGPRGGRALVVGFAAGAGLAGLRLGLLALAQVLPGMWPMESSVQLPLFEPFHSPVATGIRLAGGVALALALAMRLLPIRWAPAAAALAVGLSLRPVPIAPSLTAGLVANALFGALLVWICRRHGLTALLTAALFSFLLPAAVFACRYVDWMPGSFAVSAGLATAVPLLGLLGLSRSARAEVQRLAPPVFVRRLEEERRFRHEMDLLAKMQRGLLPRTLPSLPGYELAAHSAIANEAGGDLYDVLSDDDGYVWLAAGDVAGHGYSCAIAQAMTKAALASLVGKGRTPADVLQRADRVLRAAGFTRNFTSLALLRLTPATGAALLSNAGHPFPLLVAGGTVTEVEIPSLPLGLGPARHYEDRPLQLPPGAALVFCSDGLFEASDGGGRVYGYDRLHELLRDAGSQPADKILEMLLADWRRHLRATLPLDDTTFVVLKRSPEGHR